MEKHGLFPIGPPKSDYNRPGTIEETAGLVTSVGGMGVPFAIDHFDQEQVKQLAEHISETWGHIDVLVNDIWGAEKLKGGPPDWSSPLWQFNLNTSKSITSGISQELRTLTLR